MLEVAALELTLLVATLLLLKVERFPCGMPVVGRTRLQRIRMWLYHLGVEFASFVGATPSCVAGSVFLVVSIVLTSCEFWRLLNG